MIGLGRWKACLLGVLVVRYAMAWWVSMQLCPQEMEPPNTLQCELRSYKSKHCIGWHNWKLVLQGKMLLTAFIHVGRHIILLKGIHHSLFCHMQVELGKALSSYVQDVFCSHIYSPSNYNGLHSCTFDCRVRACILSQRVFWRGNSGFPKCSTDSSRRGENLFHHFLCKLISMYFFHFVQTIRHTAM